MRSLRDREEKVIRLWRAFYERLPWLLALLVALFTPWIDLVVSDLSLKVRIVATLGLSSLILLSNFFVSRRRKSMHVLEEENETLKQHIATHKAAARSLLGVLARQLLVETGTLNGKVRVSIYGHEKGCFYLLARQSDNPTLARPGRPFYPDDIGYLGLVWQKKTFEKSWRGSQDAQKFAKEHGYSESLYAGLSMRPLAVAALRIDRSDGRPVGVVLFECETKNGLIKHQLLDSYSTSSAFRLLRDALMSSEPIFEAVSISDN